MNEFVYNVMNTAAITIRKLKLAGKFKNYNVVIVSDEHELSYLLCGTLNFFRKQAPNMQINFVLNDKPQHPEFIEQLKLQWPEINIWNSLDSYFQNANYQNSAFNTVNIEESNIPEDNTDPEATIEPEEIIREENTENETSASSSKYSEMFFEFVNLRHPMYASMQKRTEKEAELKQILNHNLEYKDNFFQLITCIPDITEPLPEVTNAIAEREYEVIFRNYPADSLEKFVSHLEDCIRSYKEITTQVQVIRLDRVFGPGITSEDNIWVMNVLRDMFTNKKVTIYDRDRHDFASACYAKDALVGILLAMTNGRKGNIYHVSSWELSRYQVISTLYSAFPEHECSLETANEGWNKERPIEYRMLNARKLRLTHRTNLEKVLYTTKLNALKNTALWYLGEEPYIPKSDINVYYGRMNRIRELELEILKEVDAICKANDIHYFLSAGTMLGAVRHHGFIPWDDDVDISMLPEDYEKFLKVCPEHLSVDYGYQNFATETTSHYIHDKIRLKNSFFSTKYSDKYPMMNGVYIDVFIYYKTSDHPFFQKLHIRHINAVRRLIGIRWADKPRKNIHYYFSIVALPIMRLFPFIWLHKYYMHVLKHYEKKNTHYRVDSMGFNLKKVGAVPDEWFHGTIETDFCGLRLPILEHYDDYLRHWYGEHYMELLPLAGRKSVHDVIRIDLGQNLFDETKHDAAFRNVDLRGELFEHL